MAYIVQDQDESSLLDDTAMDEDTLPPAKSFLVGGHGGATRYLAPTRVPAGIDARRNLLSMLESERASSMLPQPNAQETVSVFLRIKPRTLEETQLSEAAGEADQPDNMVKIESHYQVALTAPPESHTYKNSMNGAGKMVHRYTFSKIFPPQTEQAELFHEMVLPRVSDFLEGQNQLVFTYGASSSGKTYTIQGEPDRPGILPRALDVIFNSIGDRHMSGLDLKPNCFNRVVQMRDRDVRQLEDDKQVVLTLGRELQQLHHPDASKASTACSQLSDDISLTNLSQQSLATMFPDLSSRVREDTQVDLKHDEINYSVWISFAEIYNENIHDLLERMPVPKRKDEKPPRRQPLKLAEDKNGSIYVKGLKEIKVNSADEAYQIMMIGRENLHFAATRLNHHSSRSHCIFTVKTIRVAQAAKPHLARVSMLSFCDLAGSERIKKTMNTGERQKEAGNINTSLLVLGRCMKAIRHNQQIKESKRHMIVPFRESKLTRLFQSFLVGHGRASMVVNVSQAPYLFDESMTVLKFAAVASKITVEKVHEPETVKKQPKRQTRFSIMVTEKSKMEHKNSLMGRGSIAWERPAARSTMCPMPTINDDANATFTTENDESASTTFMEETLSDPKYEGLLKLVDSLREQLIKAKQDNITLENEIRTELCTEFNSMMVDIEQKWEVRLKDQQERSDELSAWRINKLEEAYQSRKNKRKRQDEAESSALHSETMLFEKEENAMQVKCLEEQVNAMKTAHAKMMEDGKKQSEELSKRSFELAAEKTKTAEMESRLVELEKRESARRKSAENNKSDPIMEDLRRQVKDAEEKTAGLEEEKKNMKELLNEASEDFLEKEREVKELKSRVKQQQEDTTQQKLSLADLNSQLEESRLLLTDSNGRMEEMEKQIAELEDELEETRGQRADLEASLVEVKQLNVDYAQEKSNLLLQIGNLKEERLGKEKEVEERLAKEKEIEEKLAGLERALNEEKEKSALQMEEKERDITNLEREVKTLIQAENRERCKGEESQAEVSMLRKQLKELTAKSAAGGVGTPVKRQPEESGELENLRMQLASLRKEERAIEILRKELETKTEEKNELSRKIVMLQADVDARKYDVSKAKEERDTLMAHYEQQLKKLAEERDVDRREAQKIREMMARATPVKSATPIKSATPASISKKQAAERDAEVTMLREELMKKTDVIKKLEKMIPSKKQLTFDTPSKSDASASAAAVEELRLEVSELQSELEQQKDKHSKELGKVRKASDKVINEYKEANLELQRRVTSSTSSAMLLPSTTDESQEAEDDDDDEIHETPSANERKRKRGLGRTRATRRQTAASSSSSRATDSASQVSFADDSNVENHPEGADESAADADEAADNNKPKRRTRVTRSRPVRKTANDSSLVLKELVQEEAAAEAEAAAASPAPTAATRKRQLYKTTTMAAMFTPPADQTSPDMTPQTIVKRQLRTRSSRKK